MKKNRMYFLLKTVYGKKQVSIREAVAFYDEYAAARKKFIASPSAPANIYLLMIDAKMPAYLRWAIQFLSTKEGGQ